MPALNHRGFTLVEVLVSTGIIAIGMFVIMSLQFEAQKGKFKNAAAKDMESTVSLIVKNLKSEAGCEETLKQITQLQPPLDWPRTLTAAELEGSSPEIEIRNGSGNAVYQVGDKVGNGMTIRHIRLRIIGANEESRNYKGRVLFSFERRLVDGTVEQIDDNYPISFFMTAGPAPEFEACTFRQLAVAQEPQESHPPRLHLTAFNVLHANDSRVPLEGCTMLGTASAMVGLSSACTKICRNQCPEEVGSLECAASAPGEGSRYRFGTFSECSHENQIGGYDTAVCTCMK